ncbi:DEKNAAC103645 [Brettanomyces naardenensis]|uniref:DEKNAAC103645 n=1 Tax=Brettanomyces naardenensis TaxID=13370 RepID=A0A448YNL8_BRENA|nr:DEKNAAC103645 [Brettanomyces naardenensis]
MASTLKRTLTDIMEDELYSPSSQGHASNGHGVSNMTLSGQHRSAFQAQSPYIPSSQRAFEFQQSPQLSQQQASGPLPEDLSRYLHLNGSQESLELRNSAPGSPGNYAVKNSLPSVPSIRQPQQHSQSEPTNVSDAEINSIYSEFANPNIYAHTTLPDDLYSYSYRSEGSGPARAVVNPHDMQKLNDGEKNVSATENAKRYDDIDDEVMLVPQDNYMFDQSDSQYFPDILQFELGNGKLFPQSNELNIFRSNDVYLDEDFSDEEDDDEDINKLDDMEMDLDDLSSESSAGEEDDHSASADPASIVASLPSTHQVEGRNPSDFIKNPVVPSAAVPGDSIYSLTFGNHSQGLNGVKESFPPLFEEEEDSDVEDMSPFQISDVANQAIKQRADSFVSASSSASSKKMRRKSSSTAEEPALTKTVDHDDESNNEVHICTVVNPKTGLPCNKRFSRPYDLVRHQNTIHAPRRSYYRCMFCEDDLRRKHRLESTNEIVVNSGYRSTQFSVENSNNNMANSHNSRKVKASSTSGGYLSNKTFSRCDALTRHLRFRHGLNNEQVNDAMEYAKKHVEFYEN